jgi:SAM-dependent methyltransferase
VADHDTRRGVRETYERIGTHFAETRHSPWDAVERFLRDAPSGAVGLDLGCGNGRHIPLLADRVARVVGLDASRTLLATAIDRVDVPFHPLLGDAGRMPLRTNAVSVAVYIATLHHLPSPAARRESLDELARVLAPDGRALISVWSVTHDRFDATEAVDRTVDWTLPDGETVPRYYHLYDPESFAAALADSDLQVRDTFEDAGNCYGVVAGARQ